MNELIKIEQHNINGSITNSVSARDLYSKLELNKAHWGRWSLSNIINNDYFKSGIDFEGFTMMVNGNEITDYMVNIDFAKHLCMQAKTKPAHDMRNYFIECEKKANNISNFQLPQNYKEALQALLIEVDKTERLALENHQLKPKAQFYDTVTGSPDTIDMAEVAKVLNRKNLGRNKIFEFLRIKGILNQQNRPYQNYVDRGYFRLIESSYSTPDGTTHVSLKTVIFQRGLDFIRKCLDNNPDIIAQLV